VIADPRVSRRHAVLRVENGHWVLADNGSANGIYAGNERVTQVLIKRTCAVRLGHPADGLVLTCVLSYDGTGTGTALQGRAPVPRPAPVAAPGPGLAPGQAPAHLPARAPMPAPAPSPAPVPSPAPEAAPGPRPGDNEPLDIPYAVRWLVPKGERFANFDILNNNDTQLDYYRKFGHIYAVGIPTKKWRIVVVSDPELLDDVAGNELQFGKRVEDINFFDQLSNSRGGGISVISAFLSAIDTEEPITVCKSVVSVVIRDWISVGRFASK